MIRVHIARNDRKYHNQYTNEVPPNLTNCEFNDYMVSEGVTGNLDKYLTQYEQGNMRYNDFIERKNNFLSEYDELRTKYGLSIDYYMEGDTYGIHEDGLTVTDGEFSYVIGD